MIQGTVVKDSQNPYRTGVLVGNHVEDRFGQDLIAQDVCCLKIKGGNSLYNIQFRLFICILYRKTGEPPPLSNRPNTISVQQC
jgi:hypothetical protein